MNPELDSLQLLAQKMAIKLDGPQLARFELYQNELKKWNDKINLIAKNSAREIVTRHFLDSLTAARFIDRENIRIMDIGCGAGFPGLPLKIIFPDFDLYLLEANRKKISFLKHIIRLLDLQKATVLHERAESLLKNSTWKNFFQVVISRAAFKLPDMLPLAAFFLQPQGKLIALKSRNVEREFLSASSVAALYGFDPLIQYDIDEKILGTPRKIIIGEKTK